MGSEMCIRDRSQTLDHSHDVAKQSPTQHVAVDLTHPYLAVSGANTCVIVHQHPICDQQSLRLPSKQSVRHPADQRRQEVDFA